MLLRALLILVAALCVPAAAQAATATSTGSTISVTSPPGEKLDVYVGSVNEPGKLSISVLEGTLQAGTGCTQHNDSLVFCNVAGVPRVVVDLGDGDDEFAVANTIDMRVEVAGGPGNDRLSGGKPPGPAAAVTTLLDGGPGDDRVQAGAATHDTLVGGDGVDELDYATSRVPTTITMDGIADDGGAGEGDNVAGDFEDITGSVFAANTIVGSDLEVPLDKFGATQFIKGGPAADVIDGRGGHDSIDGFGGDDTLIGAAGDDLLLGADGNDRIDGGPGADNFSGGVGDDTLLSRDAAADQRLDCDDGTDTAVTDRLLDSGPVFDTCENVDAAWLGPPRLLLRKRMLKMRRGRARLPVECLAVPGAGCSGRVVARTAKPVRFRGRRRIVVLGRAAVSLKPEGRKTVALPISRAVRNSVFRRRPAVKCIVVATMRDGERTSDLAVIRAR